ncbi:hypothetical protein [Pelagibius sp.]|uniref:hypothetical protein n=1 Tax=Pelagibius sp. TaxID=1931238 RepID=UPI00260E1532|nr:hypothetical protein [Pelagibius sp.]
MLSTDERVAETPMIKDAWNRGQPLEIHGLIYAVSDGHLRNPGCSRPAEHNARSSIPGNVLVHQFPGASIQTGWLPLLS